MYYYYYNYNYYNYNTVCVFTTLQVSELCPGNIPTTIDILITNSTDDITIQNINVTGRITR